MRVIHEDGAFRIIEVEDGSHSYGWADLKGDTYDPKVHTDIDPERLAEEERRFEDLVSNEGIFGYVLERWDPSVNGGWKHVDSCFGFIGQYTPTEATFNHYIVDELKSQIKGA